MLVDSQPQTRKPIELQNAPTPTHRHNGNVGSARTHCCSRLSFIHLYGAAGQDNAIFSLDGGLAGQPQRIEAPPGMFSGTSRATTTLAMPYASLGMGQERLL
jgi:hypothetical protein